ncbi:hypothetical protein ACU4GD_37370 [Cupriavidus basilensis]
MLAAGASAVKGDMTRKGEVIKAIGADQGRQSARRLYAVEGAQSGAGFLPAQGGRPREQGRRDCRQGLADPARGCRL